MKRDSNHSNANSNHSNEIRSILMQFWHWKGILTIRVQILTIRKDSKHSNANSNHSNQIQSIWMQLLTIRKGFKALKCKLEHFEWDSKHSNAYSKILTIQMEIPSIYLNDIQRRFETFKCNFSKWIRSIRMQIWTLRTRFEAFNFIFKGILTIRVQISTIWTRFETFECKF